MTRDELRAAIRDRLHACDAVLAAWEAGSAAFERADAYSDLDIGVLARNGTIDAVWNVIERALDDVGGFTIRWENPVHIFKGMTQRVYRPTLAGPWLDLDIGVFREDAEDLYLQPQRHGHATILFDRTPERRTAAVPIDGEAHLKRMREALHQEVMRWNLYRAFVEKEIARGRTIDAFGFYLAFAVRPVLAVMGMLHRPDRWDYGFRYVKDDLPADVVAAVERLCYVGSPAELLARVAEADSLFGSAVMRLARQGIEPLDAKGVDRIAPHRVQTTGPRTAW
jgi:hypothetical protein